jgi:hypothetical protein
MPTLAGPPDDSSVASNDGSASNSSGGDATINSGDATATGNHPYQPHPGSQHHHQWPLRRHRGCGPASEVHNRGTARASATGNDATGNDSDNDADTEQDAAPQ